MDLFLEQIGDLGSRYRKRYVFELVVFGLVIIFLYRLYVPFKYTGQIMALLGLVGIILWFRMYSYNTNTIDKNEQTSYQLRSVQSQMYFYVDEQMKKIRLSDAKGLLSKRVYKDNLKRVELDYLYTDTRIIRYIHSTLPYYKYNPDSWVSIVIGVNGILRIRAELEEFYSSNGYFPVDVAYQAESAEELFKKTLNFTHTFVYSLPHGLDVLSEDGMNIASQSLTEKMIDTLYSLIKPHIVAIKKFAVNKVVKEGINRSTIITELRDHVPIGMDTKFDDTHRFELYV